MSRIIRYIELLKRGAGKFARELTDGHVIVSNEKQPENSFAILKARRLSEIYDRAQMPDKAEEVRNDLKDIKTKTSERYSKMRNLRK